MHNSDCRIKGEMLFEERLPTFVLDTTLKTHLQIMIFIWFCRLGTLILIGLAIDLVVNDSGTVRYVVAIAGTIAISLLIWATEWHCRKDRLASVPVRLYSDGIKMYAFLYQRILGFSGFIPRSEVQSIEIVRGKMKQSVDNRRDLVWEDAPVGYMVVTKKGKRYPSGPKPPGQVIAMTEAIKEKWNVPVIDPGEGRGRMTKYLDGLPTLR